MPGWVWGEIVSCFCIDHGVVSCMIELIVLREVLVMWWQTMVGIGTMIEKSQSNVLLRQRTTFFKAVIEFRWSAEKREVCAHLETCGGSVGGEN